MLKVKYEFDGENRNEALEDVIIDELKELGFEPCGDDFEDAGPKPLFVLEFESGEDDMNAHEKGFIGSEEQTTLEEIVGVSTVLQFEFEPWDEDDAAPAAAPAAPAPRSSNAAADKNIYFFGHCTTGTSDKIWGAVKAQGEWFTFWGGRTKKLSFKRASEYASGAALDQKVREKERGGYRNVTMEDMNALDPNFETRFEEELILCLMANKFHQNPYNA